MIVVRLREAMERFRRLAGFRMTYKQLSEKTGLSESTLQSIAARSDYNTTLDTVDRIAIALNCPLDDLLEQQNQATFGNQPVVAASKQRLRAEPRSKDVHGPQD
ncbi:MAG: helix-turn-helix transcriptional regulator [Myxococcales bacterium]|nr:helix-turn-helix transcriptional regulator [Myxococcales bacterium]